MNVTVMGQEEIADILCVLTDVKTFDIGCAVINIGIHPVLGRVIGIAGDADKAALIPVS